MHALPGILHCFLVMHTEPIPSESHGLKSQWWLSVIFRSFFEITVYLHTYLFSSLDGSGSVVKLPQVQPNIVHSKVTLIFCGTFTSVLSNTLSSIGCTTQMWIFTLPNSVMDTAQINRVQFSSVSTFAWCSSGKISHDQWEKQKCFAVSFQSFI